MVPNVRFALAVAAVIICAGLGVAETRSFADDLPAKIAVDADGSELKAKALSAIRENYRRLPVLRCKTVTSIENPPQKGLKLTADGLFVEALVRDKYTIEAELLLTDRALRLEGRHRETGERWSRALHNGIWTKYTPDDKSASRWYQRKNEAPEANFDPRKVAASFQGDDFLDNIARFQVLRHETVRTDGRERLSLYMMNPPSQYSDSSWHRIEFDPGRNYLPCRVVSEDPKTGDVWCIEEFQYQEVIPKSAWFLKKSDTRVFFNNPAGAPGADERSLHFTMEVVGPVRTDETLPDDAFEIRLPPGTKLDDRTVGRRPPLERHVAD